jgi:hypothetical protein
MHTTATGPENPLKFIEDLDELNIKRMFGTLII